MQWLSGVGRIFVRIGERVVQFGLLPQGSEGFMIPQKLSDQVEVQVVDTDALSFHCSLLAVGPLAAAKLKSFSTRQSDNDYSDLHFLCTRSQFRSQVREGSASFKDEWTDFFLDVVRKQEAPNTADLIRWALGKSTAF